VSDEKDGAGETEVDGLVAACFQPMVPPADPVSTTKYSVDEVSACEEEYVKTASAQAPTDSLVARSVTLIPGLPPDDV
jgi:hypothetical protein